MFNLKRLFKNYAETGAFSEKLNLHSFIDSEQFLTKTGDVGMILEVPGVDYECLDASTIDNLTKRLESAFRLFDEKRAALDSFPCLSRSAFCILHSAFCIHYPAGW